MGIPSGEVPDRYPAIRAARYGGVPVTDALGIGWCPIVQEWCLIAEAAEQEAESELMKQAQRKAESERRR